jgi:hypothetical protein
MYITAGVHGAGGLAEGGGGLGAAPHVARHAGDAAQQRGRVDTATRAHASRHTAPRVALHAAPRLALHALSPPPPPLALGPLVARALAAFYAAH